MKKLITLTIIAIAIILVIFLIAKPKTASIEQISETNNSIITVDRDMHDFGDIDIFSGKVSTEFTVTNTGDQETIILSAITSCGCTEGEINGMNFGMHSGLDSPVVIPAGETQIVTAIYDPLAHGPNGTGQITRQLFLKTNSTETPDLEFRVSANVTKESE